ncbi:MAG: glycosyltransferase [candidate division Zixibacteria bacterium]|nr:glycosyltransferase [candidate division Zixibacteria bacterium]
MIKIAFVIDTVATPSAGTEKQLLAVMNGLDKSRFEAHLICLRDSEWLQNNPLSFPVRVLFAPGLLRLSILPAIRRLATYLREQNFDLIHAHYFDSVVLTAVAALVNHKPRLLTSRRGFITSEKPQRAKQKILRLIRHRYDGVICNSHALASFVAQREGIPARKITVIYNGLNIDRPTSADSTPPPPVLSALGLSRDDIVVATVANLRPVKNISLLIAAAAWFTERNPRVHFVVIGEGSHRPYLEKQIEHLNLKARFHLLGRQERPELILAHADIGVLPSISESLSNALIEYQALGLPAVASRVGGNGEIIEHGKTGFLFESGNLGDFCEQLGRLIDDSDLRRSMGAAACRAAEKFSLARCLNEYQDYYELMAGKTEAG